MLWTTGNHLPFAILGFLSWRPHTGYDLKKLIAASEILPWSGNNNQIYTTLVDLHRRNLVTCEVQPQQSLPARKLYSITAEGRAELRRWLTAEPELPHVRNPFLIRLAWADQLSGAEFESLVARYAEEVRLKLRMLREMARRDPAGPDRTGRERYLWRMTWENRIRCFQAESDWIDEVRHALASIPGEVTA